MSKENTPTPHNAAKYGEIAENVIMAGDPLRVKYIAENFLENAVLYNSVRGMYGYTGTYRGRRISVQGHGMGIPSMGIYSHELFNFYDVQKIIRIGTCGTMDQGTPLGSVLLAQTALTDSNYGWQFNLPVNFVPSADHGLLRSAEDNAAAMGLGTKVGTVLSSDVFYDVSGRQTEMAKMGVIACEMEAFALYINAAAAGRKALTILTVTDNMLTKEGLSTQQRQCGLNNMIELALKTI